MAAEDYLNALRNEMPLAQMDPVLRNGALDALLRADPAKNLGEVIAKQRVFWDTLGVINPDRRAEAIPLIPMVVAPSIRQEAAKQRVMFGLNSAPEDVLVKILVNNEDECRAYLASRPEFGKLEGVPGLVAAPAPAPAAKVENGKTLLTDEALKVIRKQARSLLLLPLINGVEDPVLLTGLSEAKNVAELRTALETLRPSDAVASLDFFPLDASVKLQIKTRTNHLNAKKDEKEFETWVAERSPEELLNMEHLLKFDDPVFMNNLSSAFKDLNKTEVAKWKSLLGVNYINALFASKNKDRVLETLNQAKDANTLKAKLLTEFCVGGENYVNYAVVKENLNSIRSAMIQSLISKASQDEIKELLLAKGLPEFKTALKKLGIEDISWIADNKHYTAMIRTVRSRFFKDQIEKVSPLGGEAHLELVKVFKKLPLEQQVQLLNKPNELQHLLRVQDKKGLKYYLGYQLDDKTLDRVVKENKNNRFFKAIHNPVVAKVLASVQPPLTLNKAQVEAVNNLLATPGVFVAAPGNESYNIPENQKGQPAPLGAVSNDAVIASIIEEVGRDPQSKQTLKQVFTSALVVKEFLKQQKNNARIFAVYKENNESPVVQLLSLILSLEKDKELTPKEVGAIGKAVVAPGVDTTAKFMEVVAKLPGMDPKLLDGLKREVTTILFNEVRAKLIQKTFSNNPEEGVLIEEIQEALSDIRTHRLALTKDESKIAPLADVDPIHLFNPTFQGKARREAAAMRASYTQAATKCDLIIDQLKRNLSTITFRQQCLPLTNERRIGDLRKELNNEAKAVQESLNLYEKVQEKLHGKEGILAAIDEAEAGSQNYMYCDDNITISEYSQGERIPAIGSAGQARSKIKAAAGGQIADFVRGDKLAPGKTRVFDINYKNFVGRFTELRAPINEPGLVTYRHREITKISQASYEIDQFPHKKTGTQTDADLKEARLYCSMALASQILANLDAPPTKKHPIRLDMPNKDELEYTWTALMALAEKSPHLRLNRDNLIVKGPFNPEAQKGTFGGFKKESLYSSQFKDYKFKGSEGYKKVLEFKFGPNKDKGKAEAALQAFKETLAGGREKEAKEIREKGGAAPDLDLGANSNNEPQIGH